MTRIGTGDERNRLLASHARAVVTVKECDGTVHDELQLRRGTKPVNGRRIDHDLRFPYMPAHLLHIVVDRALPFFETGEAAATGAYIQVAQVEDLDLMLLFPYHTGKGVDEGVCIAVFTRASKEDHCFHRLRPP